MPHSSSPLSAGVPVRATDFPRAHQVYSQESQTNLTSTSYGNGSPEIAVRFMAPTSGRVLVVCSGGVRNNTTANEDRVFLSFRIFEGDPNNNDLIQTEEVKYGRSNTSAGNDDFQYGGHGTMVAGLTPGTFYYAQFRHRTTLGSGTADIAARILFVTPIP